MTVSDVPAHRTEPPPHAIANSPAHARSRGQCAPHAATTARQHEPPGIRRAPVFESLAQQREHDQQQEQCAKRGEARAARDAPNGNTPASTSVAGRISAASRTSAAELNGASRSPCTDRFPGPATVRTSQRAGNRSADRSSGIPHRRRKPLVPPGAAAAVPTDTAGFRRNAASAAAPTTPANRDTIR